MARNFQTNLILGGNAQGGLTALRRVQGELGKTERSTSRLRREFDNLNSRSQVLQKGLIKIGGALTAAFSVGAAVRGIQQLTSEADNIAKTARNIGITAEALQELRGAGELSGVSIEQVDDALRRFNRRLGLFISQGGGPAAKAIERLNLQVTDATGKFIGVEAALDQAIDAIARLPSKAEQAAAASELFGEDAGPKLVTLLSQGSESVKELREQIQATGSVMSTQATEAAERFSDQLTILGRQTKGFAVQIFQGLIPSLVGTFDAFQQVQSEGEGLTNVGQEIGRAFNVIVRAAIIVRETLLAVGEVITGLAVTVVGAVQQIAAPLTGFIEKASEATQALLDGEFARARDAIAGIGNQIAKDFAEAQRRTQRGLGFIGESLENRVRNAVEAVNRIAAGLEDAGDKAGSSTRQFEDFNLSLDGIGSSSRTAGEGINFFTDQLQELALDGIKRALIEATKAREQFEKVRDALIQQIVQARGAGQALVDYNRELFVSAQIAKAGVEPTSELAEEIRKLAEAAFDAEQALKGASDASQTIGSAFSEIGFNFAQAIINGQSFTDAIGSALTGFGGQQIGRALEQIFADAMEEGVEKAFKNSNTTANIAAGVALGIGQVVQGNTSQGIGQIAGTIIGALIPGIGPVIGSVIGSFIGGLFGGNSKPKFQVRGRRASPIFKEETDVTEFTRFGQIDFAFREIEDEARAQIIRGFQQFDLALAQAIRDADTRSRVATALEQFGVSSRSDSEDLGTLLQKRFDLALSAFEPAVREVIEGIGTTLEEQIQRLADSEFIREATDRLQGLGLEFTEALQIVAELEQPGEGLANTFLRLRVGILALEQVISALGGELVGSREAALEYVDALTSAAGGISELTRLFDRFNDVFFDPIAVIQAQIDAARAQAGDLLAQLGLDDSLIGDRDAFRQAFAELLPTLSPEDAAILLRAGDAIANVIQGEEELARLREKALEPLRDLAKLQADVSTTLLTFDLNEFQSAIVQIRLDGIAAAEALQEAAIAAGLEGAAASDLAAIHELTARRIQQAIARLEESGRSIAEQLFGTELDRINAQIDELINGSSNADIERALQPFRALAAQQAEIAAQLLTVDFNEFQNAIVQIRLDGIAAAKALEDAAQAAGLEAAASSDLANVQELTARRIQQAIARLEQSGRSLAEQLFGTELDQINAQIEDLQESLGGVGEVIGSVADASAQAAIQLQRFADSLLIGNLSPLNSGDQLAEALRQLRDASARGDASAVQTLATSVLQIGRDRFASGQEFNDLFAEVQRIIRGTTPASERPQPVTIVGGEIEVSPELQALLERQAELQAQQQAQQDAILGNQLAQIIADLAAETGDSFSEVAARLGDFDLEQLAGVLGLDLTQLDEFLRSLQVDTESTALAISTMEAALVDELIAQTGVLEQIEALLARRGELEAERQAQQDALLANQLAQVIADIAAEDDRTFAQIADALGFDLEQLADVLGLDLAGLETFIASLQVDTMETASAIASMEQNLLEELIAQTGLLEDIRERIGPISFGSSESPPGTLPPGAFPPIGPPGSVLPPGTPVPPPPGEGINPPLIPRELIDGVEGTTAAVEGIGQRITTAIETGDGEVVQLLRRIANELERNSGISRGNTRVAV